MATAWPFMAFGLCFLLNLVSAEIGVSQGRLGLMEPSEQQIMLLTQNLPGMSNKFFSKMMPQLAPPLRDIFADKFTKTVLKEYGKPRRPGELELAGGILDFMADLSVDPKDVNSEHMAQRLMDAPKVFALLRKVARLTDMPESAHIIEYYLDQWETGKSVDLSMVAKLVLVLIKDQNPPLGELVQSLWQSKVDTNEFFRLTTDAVKFAAENQLTEKGLLSSDSDVLKFFADREGRLPGKGDIEKFLLILGEKAEKAHMPPAFIELIKLAGSFAAYKAGAKSQDFDLVSHMIDFISQTDFLFKELRAPEALTHFNDHAIKLLHQGVKPEELLHKRSVPLLIQMLQELHMPQTAELLLRATAPKEMIALQRRYGFDSKTRMGEITKEFMQLSDQFEDMIAEFGDRYIQ